MSDASARDPRIALVAGEASGDQLGGHLLRALKSRFPRLRSFGIGGPKMAAAGFESLYPMEHLAVRGYTEVLRSLPRLLRMRRDLRRRILADPPDVFIGIDAPDFNLDLELSLRRRGIATVQYVIPQVWAWRRERIHKVRRATDLVLVLFPFEVSLCEEAGIRAAFVGHPLADQMPELPDRESAREQLRLPRDSLVVALLPGSRQSEVRQHADLMVATARIVAAQTPNAHFLVPLVSRETRLIFEGALYRQRAEHLPLTILFGHAHDAMTAADAALVASGTATLEAALLKCAMVITYTVPPASLWLMKRRGGYIPYIGLPNILAGEFVVPEILQDDATPENLAQALVNLLGDKLVRTRLEARFLQIHRELKQDTAARAVEAILPLLERLRSGSGLVGSPGAQA